MAGIYDEYKTADAQKLLAGIYAHKFKNDPADPIWRAMYVKGSASVAELQADILWNIDQAANAYAAQIVAQANGIVDKANADAIAKVIADANAKIEADKAALETQAAADAKAKSVLGTTGSDRELAEVDVIATVNNPLTVGKVSLTGLQSKLKEPAWTISEEEIKLAETRVSDRISTITPQIEQLRAEAENLTNSYKLSLKTAAEAADAFSASNDTTSKVLYAGYQRSFSETADTQLGQLAEVELKLMEAKQSLGNTEKAKAGLKRLGTAAKILEGVGSKLDYLQIGIGGTEIAVKYSKGEKVTTDDFNKLASDTLGVLVPMVSLYKAYGSLSGINDTIDNSFKSMVSTSENLQKDMQSVYAKISSAAFNGEKITTTDFENFSKFMITTTQKLENLDTKFKTIGVLSSVNVVFEGKTDEYGNMINEWHQVLAAFKKIDANSFMAEAYAAGLKERYNADMAIVVSKTAELLK